LLNGLRGGVAGILFVLPGVVALLGLSALYVTVGNSTLVTARFAGLAPAVLSIVAQAVFKVAGRGLGHPALVSLAIGAFISFAVFGIAFPVVVATATIIGWALGRWLPQTMRRPRARRR
jgi:chromate transporter